MSRKTHIKREKNGEEREREGECKGREGTKRERVRKGGREVHSRANLSSSSFKNNNKWIIIIHERK